MIRHAMLMPFRHAATLRLADFRPPPYFRLRRRYYSSRDATIAAMLL
jgi:hypothetical protein